ncbi:sil1 nucleotide exchange factor isoform X2 [Oratosquilla oratoria]|uniref:sil1 nucleotide exchange factor isoform X2 n=1 Tax=Oratosquilla oratoria TaxID=337810 RepID=UPI003F76199A
MVQQLTMKYAVAVLVLLLMGGLYRVRASTGIVLVDSDDPEDGKVEEELENTKDKKFDISKVFLPTQDWQAVQPDQTLLPGLHVRMNLETGVKEAKLMDGDDGSKYYQYLRNLEHTGHTGVYKASVPSPVVSQSEEDEHTEEWATQSHPEIMREDILEALKNIKSDEGKTPENHDAKKKFRSYKELEKEFDELNMVIETDIDIMKRLLSQYHKAKQDSEKVIVLEDLEYLVHQYDSAVELVHFGVINSIVKPAINDSNPSIRKGALHLIGSAMQSNPIVQIAALEADMLSYILRILALDAEINVRSRAVFALSCLVRGFPYGQQLLVKSGGLDVLKKTFDVADWKSHSLQLKVITLLRDLMTELSDAEGEKARQLENIHLGQELVNMGWCPLIPNLLASASFDKRDRRYDLGAAIKKEFPLRPDHDMVEKVVEAMVTLRGVCGSSFHEAVPLLQKLAYMYDDLAYKEKVQMDDDDDDGVFQGISSKTSDLLKTLVTHKTEL